VVGVDTLGAATFIQSQVVAELIHSPLIPTSFTGPVQIYCAESSLHRPRLINGTVVA
jgi:hypothetical protein